jgi:hypothetical protein
MRCHYCKQEGKKSSLHDLGSSTTLIGGAQSYWDSDGKKHYHDYNTTTTSYMCSEGHRYLEKKKIACPSCDVNHEHPTRTLSPDVQVR